MLAGNISLDYALLLLKSIGRKSFSALGRVVNLPGRVISKLLLPSRTYIGFMRQLAVMMFADETKLFIMIDETLLNKMYSAIMCGTSRFYDTKLHTSYTAYKLIIATISNGDYTLPLECSFLFDPKLCNKPVATRKDFILHIMSVVKELFPGKRVIFLMDGAFATEEYLAHCVKHEIETQLRMPSNRVVEYRGKRVALRDIVALRPKGRQMARTIRATWHGLELFFTADRRIDKHGEYSVVYQVATYRARPCEHVAHYRVRWGVEKKIRTGKLSCGLQDCYSTDLQIQLKHVNASLFALAIAQIECQRAQLLNPEAAIRSIKHKNLDSLKRHFMRTYQLSSFICA